MKPLVIMSMILLMEEVEQSGRRSVGGEQQEEDKRGDRDELNNDKRYLLVWIFSFSPELLATTLIEKGQWRCLGNLE